MSASGKNPDIPRPRHEVKKIYAKGSPGAARAKARVTLTALKKGIAEGLASRKALSSTGLIK